MTFLTNLECFLKIAPWYVALSRVFTTFHYPRDATSLNEKMFPRGFR